MALGNLTSVLHSKGQTLSESAQRLWYHSRLDAQAQRLSPAPAILTALEEGTQVPGLGCQHNDGSPFTEGQALILTPGSLPSLSLFQLVYLHNCWYFSATLHSSKHFPFKHLQKIYALLPNHVFLYPICDLGKFVPFLLSCLFSVGGMDVCNILQISSGLRK